LGFWYENICTIWQPWLAAPAEHHEKKSDPKNSVLTPEDAKQKTFKWHLLVSDKGVKKSGANTTTFEYLYIQQLPICTLM
jgi:hypothetical protein